MNKKTILFFPFNLLSHYLRCLVLADTYNKDQYRILFLSSQTYNGFVRQHGYETFECEQFDATDVLESAHRFDFSWLNEPTLKKILLSQTAAIKTWNAAIVVGDVAPTLSIAAELTGVLHISLLNGYMTKYYSRTRKIPRGHKAYWFLKKLPVKVANAMTNLGEQITFCQIQRPFNKLRKKYGLPGRSDYLSEIEGMQTLICDMPALFPQKKLPPSFQVIGPLIYEPAVQSSTSSTMARNSKPVICVCMGSTGDWDKLDFLNKIYYSRYIIVTAGDQNNVLSAAHIISHDFVNLNDLLKTCSLMICHGGNGTIYTGILNHVYMLCLPNHFEQEWNIDALERNGYGRSADGFTEANWKAHIAACCTYSCNQQVLSLSPS